MPAGATYEPIATTTVAVAANAITFSSIPSTYTDLRVVLVGTASAISSDLRVKFNGDGANNYSYVWIYGDGASATSANGRPAPYLNLTPSATVSTTQPTFASLDVFSYAGSTLKTALATLSNDYNGTGNVSRSINLWRSTAAITSIQISLSTGINFTIGSTFTLYGIKNA